MSGYPLVHHGVDGLDVALQGALPPPVLEYLTKAKADLIADKQEYGDCNINGIDMQLSANGRRGGYAYVCNTGPEGAIWAFKNSHNGSEWNIHVSFASFTLAKHGMAGAKAQLYEILTQLGAVYGKESISRFDYAFDFLMPASFSPESKDFVSHARITKSVYFDNSMRETGKSNKVQTVMFGKQPGAQITLYDKRADTITKNKPEWWLIWNEFLRRSEQAELDRKNANGPKVWRIELRAGKVYLKEKCGISSWQELEEHLDTLLKNLAAKLSYCIPNGDNNRSRWPLHPLWQQLHDEIKNRTDTSADLSTINIKAIKQKQLQDRMCTQLLGLAAPFAVAFNLPEDDIPAVAAAISRMFNQKLPMNPKGFIKGIKRAKGKHCMIL